MKDTSMLERAIALLKKAKSDDEIRSTLMLIDSEVSCMLMDLHYDRCTEDLKALAKDLYSY